MDIPKTIQTLRYENDKDKRLIQSLQFEFRAKLDHELTSTSDNGEYTPYSEQFIEYDISTEEKCKDLLNSVLSSPISINSFLSICQDIEKQYPSLIYDLDSTLIKLSESENTISKLKILQKYIENDTRKTEANLNLKKIKSIPASNELSAICSDKSFIPLYKFDDNFNNGDDECLLILFNDLHFVFNNTKHEIKYCKSLNSKEISTIKYSDILDENKGDVYCLNNIKTKLYITQIKNDEMTVTIFPKGFVSKNTMKNEFSIKLKGNVDTSAKIDRNPFNENIKVFYEDGTSQNIDLTIKKIGPDDKLYSDSIFVTKAYYEDSNKVLYTHSFCSFENNLHFTKQKFEKTDFSFYVCPAIGYNTDQIIVQICSKILPEVNKMLTNATKGENSTNNLCEYPTEIIDICLFILNNFSFKSEYSNYLTTTLTRLIVLNIKKLELMKIPLTKYHLEGIVSLFKDLPMNAALLETIDCMVKVIQKAIFTEEFLSGVIPRVKFDFKNFDSPQYILFMTKEQIDNMELKSAIKLMSKMILHFVEFQTQFNLDLELSNFVDCYFSVIIRSIQHVDFQTISTLIIDWISAFSFIKDAPIISKTALENFKNIIIPLLKFLFSFQEMKNQKEDQYLDINLSTSDDKFTFTSSLPHLVLSSHNVKINNVEVVPEKGKLFTYSCDNDTKINISNPSVDIIASLGISIANALNQCYSSIPLTETEKINYVLIRNEVKQESTKSKIFRQQSQRIGPQRVIQKRSLIEDAQPISEQREFLNSEKFTKICENLNNETKFIIKKVTEDISSTELLVFKAVTFKKGNVSILMRLAENACIPNDVKVDYKKVVDTVRKALTTSKQKSKNSFERHISLKNRIEDYLVSINQKCDILINQEISFQMTTQQILSFILSDLTVSDIGVLHSISNKRKEVKESTFSYMYRYLDKIKNDDLLYSIIRNIDEEIFMKKEIIDKLMEIYEENQEEDTNEENLAAYNKENLKTDLSDIGNNKFDICDKVCQIRELAKKDKEFLDQILDLISPDDVKISTGCLAILGFHNFDISTTCYGFVKDQLKSVQQMTISEFKNCKSEFKVLPPTFSINDKIKQNIQEIIKIIDVKDVNYLNDYLQLIKFCGKNSIDIPPKEGFEFKNFSLSSPQSNNLFNSPLYKLTFSEPTVEKEFVPLRSGTSSNSLLTTSRNEISLYLMNAIKSKINYEPDDPRLLSIYGVITEDEVYYVNFPNYEIHNRIERSGIPFYISYYNDQKVEISDKHTGEEEDNNDEDDYIDPNISSLQDFSSFLPRTFVGQTVFINEFGPGIIIGTDNTLSKVYVINHGKEMTIDVPNDEIQNLNPDEYYESLLRGVYLRSRSDFINGKIKEIYEKNIQNLIVLEMIAQNCVNESLVIGILKIIDDKTSKEIFEFLKRNEEFIFRTLEKSFNEIEQIVVENYVKYFCQNKVDFLFAVESNKYLQAIVLNYLGNIDFISVSNYNKIKEAIKIILISCTTSNMNLLNQYFMFLLDNDLENDCNYQTGTLLALTYYSTEKISPAAVFLTKMTNRAEKFNELRDKKNVDLNRKDSFEDKLYNLITVDYNRLRRDVLSSVDYDSDLTITFNRFNSTLFMKSANKLYMFNTFIAAFRQPKLCRIRVMFEHEGGIDQGGLKREAFTMIGEEIKNNLFTVDEKGFYHLKTKDPQYQLFIGVFIAYCFYYGEPFEINLPFDIKDYILSESSNNYNPYSVVKEGFQEIIPEYRFVTIQYTIHKIALVFGSSDRKLKPEDIIHRLSGYSETVKVFSDAIRTFSSEELSELLRFITGTSTLSYTTTRIELNTYSGNSDISDESKWDLPIAHTCFKSLDLRPYKNSEILANKLKLAMSYSKIISDGGMNISIFQ